VREEFAQVKFYDKSDNFLVAMINIWKQKEEMVYVFSVFFGMNLV
jgi:hypothetical protein